VIWRHADNISCIDNLKSTAHHTASDQILEVVTAWERGYLCACVSLLATNPVSHILLIVCYMCE